MAGTRDALQDAMRTALIANATLAALLGATSTDKRIYSGNDKRQNLLSTSQPGYVTLFPVSTRGPELDRETKRIQLSCFALKLTTVNQIADQVDVTLHRKALTPTGWTTVSIQRVSEVPAWMDTEGAFHLPVDFELKVF